jgi:hypothetical protein
LLVYETESSTNIEYRNVKITAGKALNNEMRSPSIQNVFLDEFGIYFLITNCAPFVNAILLSQDEENSSLQLGNMLLTPEFSPLPSIIFYSFFYLLIHKRRDH